MKIKLIIIYIIIVIILCVINYKLSSKDIDPSEKTNVIDQDNLNDINYSDGLNDSDNLDKINDTNDLNNNTNNLSADDPSARFNSIKSIIDSYVNKYNTNDNISVYYYNLSTGDKYSFNEDKLFIAASLKKLPLVMEVLDKISAGELSFTDKVTYLPKDYSDGTGILQSADDISTVSIDRLLQLCITESDNIAYNMLNRICGNTIIDYANNNICNNCLINDNGYLKTSAKSVYQILNRLYFSQDNSYAKIIDYMKHTQFNDSLNKYLPEEKVAHKIGSYYRYYHDAAIIYGDETYILVVMTKDLGTLTEGTDLAPNQEERYLVDWGSEAFESMAKLSQEIYKAK